MSAHLLVGGAGFVGANLSRALSAELNRCIVIDNASALGGIRPLPTDVELYKLHAKQVSEVGLKDIDTVFYMAAKVGGITLNSTRSRLMYEANVDALTGLEACYRLRPRLLVFFSTVCVYPADAPVPTTESWGAVGEPEVTNRGYGMAKREGELAALALSNEFSVPTLIIRPSNLYGPWDYFGPEYAHFIPTVISQMMRNKKRISVIGGSQLRAFLYVDDLVRCLMQLIEDVEENAIVNVGHSETISIREATNCISDATGYRHHVDFISGTEGHRIRASDSFKLEQILGSLSWTPFEEGIERTIAWLSENRVDSVSGDYNSL